MELAHSTHMAADTMWCTVREMWYWSTMTNDLQVRARDCVECKFHDVSKQRQKAVAPDDITVMERMDLVDVD